MVFLFFVVFCPKIFLGLHIKLFQTGVFARKTGKNARKARFCGKSAKNENLQQNHTKARKTTGILFVLRFGE